MSAIFDASHFTDDRAAREFLERVLWPDGPVCPHCGVVNNAFAIKRKGQATGVYRCNACRADFTVTMKTVMERSHIRLHKWLLGFHLMTSSKKGVSAHQLHRTLGITYRSAWFMAHRIREAMRAGGLKPPTPLGGEGKIVEVDETYHGKIEGPIRHSRPRARKYWKPTKGGLVGPAGKRAIVALVERGGSVRSFHVTMADKATINDIIKSNIVREARIHTDESRLYGDVSAHFAEHMTIRHSSGEYVRGEVHTNTVENVFSIFKRGMRGIYQHCKEKHLHRYLAEYDFRYNHRVGLGFNDTDRTIAAVKGAEGKRLTYRQPHEARH
jgi:transposase-like protein